MKVFNGITREAQAWVEREAEHKLALKLLESGVRCVTLTGPGGVGKTHLAQAIRRTLATRGRPTMFLDVSAVQHTADLWGAVIYALAVEQADDAWHGLTQCLQREAPLLVLDNLEQIGDVASWIARLLCEVPALQLLCTSRVALELPTERRVTLRGLAEPAGEDAQSVICSPAGRLLVTLLEQVRPAWHLTDTDAPECRRLCLAVDGLPLGIELLAGLFDVMSLQGIYELVRTDQLPGTTATALVARHRSLLAVVSWSFELLGTEERQALCRWGLFTTWFSAADARSCGPEGTLTLLVMLAKRHLVQTAQVNGHISFRLPETVKSFARVDLRANGHWQTSVLDHAAWLSIKLNESNEPSRPILDAYQDDAVATLAYLAQLPSSPESADATLQLAERAAFWWKRHGRFGLAETHLRVALRQQGHELALYVRVLMHLAAILRLRGQSETVYGEAETLVDQALVFSAQVEDAQLRVSVLRSKATYAREREDFTRAETWLRQALQDARTHLKGGVVATILSELAWVAFSRQQYGGASRLYAEALMLLKSINDPGRESIVATNAALVSLNLGDYDEALNLYRRSLWLSTQADDPLGVALAHMNIATTVCDAGDLDTAQKEYHLAGDCFDGLDDTYYSSHLLFNRGVLALYQGQPALALTQLNEAATRAAHYGEDSTLSMSRAFQVWALATIGQDKEALDLARAALTEPERSDVPEAPLALLSALVQVSVQRGLPLNLAYLMGLIEGRQATTGFRIGRPWAAALEGLYLKATLGLAEDCQAARLAGSAAAHASIEDQINLLEQPVNVTAAMPTIAVVGQTPQVSGAIWITSNPFHLTPRELDLVRLLAQGLSNKVIARELGLSEATVRSYFVNIFGKMGVKSRIEALKLIMERS